MKYIKTYENIINISEYVKCINVPKGFNDVLTLNKIYKILKIEHHSSFKMILIVDNNNEINWYNMIIFKKATLKEIEQYQLSNSTNKYNI